MTDRQLRSVWTTTFATLRWTKSSPGKSPTISFAGTRLSAQPIQRYCGVCWCDRRLKKFGSRCVIAVAHFRLFSKRCPRMRMKKPLGVYAENATGLSCRRGEFKGGSYDRRSEEHTSEE